MSKIKYISVHESENGKRVVRPGEQAQSHNTVKMPSPDNGLEDMERVAWERVGVFPLPEPIPKSELGDWWNENLNTEDEPEVIDTVLRVMGERGEDQ